MKKLLKTVRETAVGKSICCTLVLVFALAISLVAPMQGATSYIMNGDFEIFAPGNTVIADNYTICRTSTTSCVSNLANWSSTCHGTVNNLSCGTGGTVAGIMTAGSNAQHFNRTIGLWGTIANSPTGGNFLAIDGDPAFNASISQTITGLTAGRSYVLAFDMAAGQQSGTSGDNTEFWRVTFGTQMQDSVTISNPSHGFKPWIHQVMTFTADSSSQVLTFLALGTPAGGPPAVLLDGLTLTDAVPEPGTFLMLGLGLVAVALARKRK